jgi:hypothetical protein
MAISGEVSRIAWEGLARYREIPVEIGLLCVGGRAVGDCADAGRERLGVALLQTLVAFAQSVGDGAPQSFSGFLGDRLGEPMRFGVFDVERGFSFLLYHLSTFF